MATPVANSVPLLTPVNNNDGTLIDEFISGLAQGSSWATSGGVISYSFSINDETIYPWDSTYQSAFVQALSAWSSVANITFVESGSGSVYTQSPADLAITLTGNELQSSLGAAALGIFPDPVFADELLLDTGYSRGIYPNPEGDIFFDNSYFGYQYLAPGGWGLTTMIHEIGHALGLKHPFDAGGNERPTFNELSLDLYDQNRWTVMSYNAPAPSTAGHAASLMPLDILTIQHIYGANMSYHAGDDVYVIASNLNNPLQTIWDAGGTDTFDASGFSQPLWIGLQPGYGYVQSQPATDGLTAIAFNVTIENAIGGSGNDTITGNDASNTLNGGGGTDTLSGGAGNDTYIIDNLADVMMESFNQGIDTVVSPFTYSLSEPGRMDFENITLTGTADINASGNYSSNTLIGNNGNNVIHGYGGLDTMIGGTGNDTYIVWVTGDVIVENSGEGDDTVDASVTYTLSPHIENLTLNLAAGVINGFGNTSANVITGNAAANLLEGGDGADTLIGGAGEDTFGVDNASDVVLENAEEGTDKVLSAVTYALGLHLENLRLTGAANIGGAGNGGSNRIAGNAGNNLLDGGAGADTLGGGNGHDIYIVDHTGDVVAEGFAFTALVSTAADGTQANGFSDNAFISDDGGHVAFQSYATNLASPITYSIQIFVKNLQTGDVVLASSASDGAPANSNVFSPKLSADGRYVVFESIADNLVVGDTDGNQDIFHKDLLTGTVTRVSTDSVGNQASGNSYSPGISADGRYVAFSSNAGDLVGSDNGGYDAFLKDLQTGATTLVSTDSNDVQVGAGSNNVGISANGHYVVFESATSFIAGDANGAVDLYRKDLLTGETVLVSSASDGTPSSLNSDPVLLQLNGSSLGGISADGRHVAFSSVADNLVAGDTNGQIDVFLKDLLTGITTRVSTGSGGIQANNGSNGSGLSADGRYVVFNSIATNLAPGDTDESFDVYIKDTQTGLTALVSAPEFGVKQGNLSSGYSLSGDGHSVVFRSFTSNLVAGDANSSGDIFVAGNLLFDPGGFDEVRSSVDYALGSYLERLTLTGTDNTTGVGNDLANSITGNSGNNVLSGGLGNDSIDGGAGVDTANYSGATSVSVTLWNGSVANDGQGGTDTLINIENVIGGGFNDTLVGSTAANRFEGADGNDLLFADAGNDTLYGGNGDDRLNGGAGNDTLDGGAGVDVADYFSVGAGVSVTLWNNTVANDGQGGSDTLISVETVLGSNFNDILVGSVAANRFEGADGNDLLFADAGNDTLYGGNGDDRLNGGAGNDTLDGGAGVDIADYFSVGAGISVTLWNNTVVNDGQGGADTLVSIETVLGSNFNDTLVGSVANNRLEGAGGNDLLFADAGADTLYGGNGDDRLNGGAGNDTLDGGAGVDIADYFSVGAGVSVTLWNNTVVNDGQGGSDTLISIETVLGSNFNDTLVGSVANNRLEGAGGNDLLFADAGNDTLYGGNGDDRLNGGAGNDTLDGGAGVDVADYFSVGAGISVTLWNTTVVNDGQGGSDTLVSIETVLGSNFNDTLVGSAAANRFEGADGNDRLFADAGNDTLFGGNGNDTLAGGAGNDTLDGGAGVDVADYFSVGAGVSVTLWNNTVVNDGQGGSDSLISIETVLGSNFNDTLVGSAAANRFEGADGNDLIFADAGNDTLIGGAGNDTLSGGNNNDQLTGSAGADAFRFDFALGGANIDQITDFVVVDDTIQLENGIFTSLSTGALAAGSFVSGASAAAVDANDYIIYDTNTGFLSYDADGVGGAGAQQFATLNTMPALTASDFLVV